MLGYRVAQPVAGRGVATATVQELCRLAAAEYGLRTLRAQTSYDNVASQKVLTKAGFVPCWSRPSSAVDQAPGIGVTWRPTDLRSVADDAQQRQEQCEPGYEDPALPVSQFFGR